jgi:Uma2 family endonuclease
MGRMVGVHETWSRHAFTVEEVERMVATGVLLADAHVELLDGDLVEVSPQGPEHAARHTVLRDRLSAAYRGLGHVRDQCPLLADTTNLPEPDLAVVFGEPLDYLAAHPRGSDALLVIELSVSSQRLDRAKASTYARAGVATYWLIDVVARAIEEYRGPAEHGYLQRRSLGLDAVIQLPGLALRWRIDSLV